MKYRLVQTCYSPQTLQMTIFTGGFMVTWQISLQPHLSEQKHTHTKKKSI